MTLDNLNGTSPNRPAHSGGISRQQRTEAPEAPGSSAEQPLVTNNDRVQITSPRYNSDLEFAHGVYDKLEATSVKKLKDIKARYAEDLHNTGEVHDTLSETLARKFSLEQLHEQIMNTPPENLVQLTPQRQHMLIHNDDVLRATVEKLIKDLNDL